jgi:hypothetical protein
MDARFRARICNGPCACDFERQIVGRNLGFVIVKLVGRHPQADDMARQDIEMGARGAIGKFDNEPGWLFGIADPVYLSLTAVFGGHTKRSSEFFKHRKAPSRLCCDIIKSIFSATKSFSFG